MDKEDDIKLLQLTSGRGPAECCWVVAQVLKFLIQELKSASITYTVIHREEGMENNTLVSAIIQIEGSKKQLESIAPNWVGTIQWIGKSTFRKFHKRKNWFIGINELEIPPNMKSIRDSDISYQSTRAGGPGGQHVNKVSTAIRATHIPTGISVLASDHKSQVQNKKAARMRLEMKLKTQVLLEQQQKAKEGWQNHNELERGNPVKVFHGTDFKVRHKKEKKKADRKKVKAKLKGNDYEQF